MRSVDVYFKQFASECTCNGTSLVAHEHDVDCVALRDFYYVEGKLHEADSLRAQLAEARSTQERMSTKIYRLREALEKILEPQMKPVTGDQDYAEPMDDADALDEIEHIAHAALSPEKESP